MIQKRPHTLKYTSSSTAPHQDGEGNWVPGEAGAEVEIPCRYEPNGAAKEVAGPDGTHVLYNGIMYLSKDAADIPYNASVSVFDGNEQIATGSVIRFSKGQMNARLWV